MGVLRYDNLAPKIDAVDPETGILRGRAILAKEGVYRYSDQSGAAWFEYVPRSTLADPAWINTLKLAPVTLNHPTEMVTADNARYLAVGAIGDGVVMLGDRLASPIAIYAREAVDAARADLTQRSPSQRFGTAEEVASAVLYLASPASSYVVGAELVVDGGFSQLM